MDSVLLSLMKQTECWYPTNYMQYYAITATDSIIIITNNKKKCINWKVQYEEIAPLLNLC